MGCTSRQASLFKGLNLAMLSGICSSIVSMIIKHMKNLHPGQLATYRFIALACMSMPAAMKTGHNILGPHEYRLYLLLRGILGAFGFFLLFVAYRYLSLSEASVIVSSNPALVTIFAWVFFKEPCNMSQSISVTLTIVGIIFTTKLPNHLHEVSITYSSEKIYGLVAAVLSLFCMSAVQLITRKIKSVHQSIITFSYGCVCILGTAILTGVLGNFKWHHCGLEGIKIVLLGVLGFFGQTILVIALQCEYAGPVSTVSAAANIAFVFVWEIYIFHDVPDIYGIIGAVLVLVSIILIGIGKWFTSLEGNFLSCAQFKFN